MNRVMGKSIFTTTMLLVLLAVPAFAASHNKSVTVDAGAEANGASTVNGSITIGENAVINGDSETVNGSIRVGSGVTLGVASTVNGKISIADNVRMRSISTVNGGVNVGAATSIDGGVEAVNGGISIENGAIVSESVSNVNGEIQLSGSTVGGNVTTVNGDLRVIDGAAIRGDIVVEKASGWQWRKKDRPKIIIGPGSSVDGIIRLGREVDLFISDSARVGGVEGVMSLDDAVRFSGERP
jgi:DUF4097 and DUF4098 domain-containing protein YvlB